MSKRLCQIDTFVVTITSDKVSVRLHLALVVEPDPNDLVKAYYRYENFEQQACSYVQDAARSEVAKFTLNNLYENSTTACDHIRQSIKGHLMEAGWVVHDVLMLNITPETRVYRAMQEVKISQYQRERDLELSKARKAYEIKQAEGEADAQHLKGIGVNNQRKAFFRGFQVQNKILGKGFNGFNESHVLRMMHMMAYLQSMGHVAKDAGNSTVFMSHDPRTAKELVGTLVDYMKIAPGMSLGDYSEEDALADLTMLQANPTLARPEAEDGEGGGDGEGGSEGEGSRTEIEGLAPPDPVEMERRG